MSKKSSDAIYEELGDAAGIIPRRIITRYAKICALHNRLSKLRRFLRGELLDALDEGVVQATDGPFVLAQEKQTRLDEELWSWKIFALELAIQVENGDVGAGIRRCIKAESQAPRKDIPVLRAKANPGWGSSRSPWIEGGLHDDESADPHF